MTVLQKHHASMPWICIPPQTPLLNRKSGVCRGISIFLVFASIHRLWVLVRTALARRFYSVPTIYVLSKNKKNIKYFLLKIFIFFTTLKISVCCMGMFSYCIPLRILLHPKHGGRQLPTDHQRRPLLVQGKGLHNNHPLL